MDRKRTSDVVFGLLLVTVGLLFLAGRFDVIHVGAGVLRLWPFALVAFGVAELLTGPAERNPGRAAMLILGGGVFFLHTSGLLLLRHSWPLFIVVGGIALLLGDGRGRSGCGHGRRNDHVG